MRLLLIITLFIATTQLTWAGRLSNFEKSANTSNGSSSSNDDDSDISFFFELLELLFSDEDDDHDSYNHYNASKGYNGNMYSDPVYVQRDYEVSKMVREADTLPPIGIRGWEVQARMGTGSWGEGFKGYHTEVSAAKNFMVYQINQSRDQEILMGDTAYMQTFQMRAGFQFGEFLPNWQLLFGVGLLSVEEVNAFYSFRLGYENRRKFTGFRVQLDADFTEDKAGYIDFYTGGLLKYKPIQFDFGYRLRTTWNSIDDKPIHGPQVGLTLRFGKWHKQ